MDLALATGLGVETVVSNSAETLYEKVHRSSTGASVWGQLPPAGWLVLEYSTSFVSASGAVLERVTRYPLALATSCHLSWICPGMLLSAVRELGPAGIGVIVPLGAGIRTTVSGAMYT
jgi:hypothetical protein